MQVISALLMSSFTATDKLTFIDVRDTWHGGILQPFPMTVAVALQINPNNFGKTFEIGVEVVNLDAWLMDEQSPRLALSIPDLTDSADAQRYIQFPLRAVELPAHGQYRVNILIDGHIVQYLPLNYLPPR